MKTARFSRALVACVLFALSTGRIAAQFTQSSILGAVRDASGSAVANADVTIRNEGTNFTRPVKTNEEGDYRVAGLEAGFYRVTVSAPGFKTFEQTRIDVT